MSRTVGQKKTYMTQLLHVASISSTLVPYVLLAVSSRGSSVSIQNTFSDLQTPALYNACSTPGVTLGFIPWAP